MIYRVVQAGHGGPYFHEFKDKETLLAVLLAWRQAGSSDETATLWKRVRSAWVPVFPWQHKARA